MIGGGVAVALLAVIGGGAWWLFQSSPGTVPTSGNHRCPDIAALATRGQSRSIRCN